MYFIIIIIILLYQQEMKESQIHYFARILQKKKKIKEICGTIFEFAYYTIHFINQDLSHCSFKLRRFSLVYEYFCLMMQCDKYMPSYPNNSPCDVIVSRSKPQHHEEPWQPNCNPVPRSAPWKSHRLNVHRRNLENTENILSLKLIIISKLKTLKVLYYFILYYFQFS